MDALNQAGFTGALATGGGILANLFAGQSPFEPKTISDETTPKVNAARDSFRGARESPDAACAAVDQMEDALNDAVKRQTDWMNGIETGGARAIATIHIVQDACVIAATVATGGAAATIGAGALLGGEGAIINDFGQILLELADGQKLKPGEVATAIIDTAAQTVLGAMGAKVTADGGSLANFLVSKGIKGISANLIGQAVGNIIQNQWASFLAQMTGQDKLSVMTFIGKQVGALLLGALPTDVAQDARQKLGIQS